VRVASVGELGLSVLLEGLAILRRERTKLVLVNVLFFGGVVLGGLIGIMNPSVQETMIAYIAEQAKTSPLFSEGLKAYLRKDVLMAFVFTLLVNLTLGAFVSVTLPGLLVAPSLGILGYRALQLGIVYSPTTLRLFQVMLYALPVLLIEGEGYVLASLVGINLGLAWLKPNWLYREATSRKQAFIRALKESWKVYTWIAIVLLVSAIVEVIIVIFVM